MSGAQTAPALGESFVGREVEALLSSGERVRGVLTAVDGELNCLIRAARVDGAAVGELLLNGSHMDALYPVSPAE